MEPLLPWTRYEQELDHAAWLARWREIRDSCTGLSLDGAVGERVREYYFPKFDEAYHKRDTIAFDHLLRKFHVGVPCRSSSS